MYVEKKVPPVARNRMQITCDYKTAGGGVLNVRGGEGLNRKRAMIKQGVILPLLPLFETASDKYFFYKLNWHFYTFR